MVIALMEIITAMKIQIAATTTDAHVQDVTAIDVTATDVTMVVII